ncbi:MAG: hypothetical protein JSS02_21360 [Planctomycetes bacterium]|nr:hypothetical protein [Planctomycetota bacterium]
MNNYDAEHVTTNHRQMSAQQWQKVYYRAWHLYYSRQHVETLLRRAMAGGSSIKRVAAMIFLYHGSYRFENVHPLQRHASPRTSPGKSAGFLPAAAVGNAHEVRVGGRLLLVATAVAAAHRKGPRAAADADLVLTPPDPAAGPPNQGNTA